MSEKRGRKVNVERQEIITSLIKLCKTREEFVDCCKDQLNVSEGSAMVYWYKHRQKPEVVGSEYKEKFENLVLKIQEKFEEAKAKKRNSSVFKELLELG